MPKSEYSLLSQCRSQTHTQMHMPFDNQSNILFTRPVSLQYRNEFKILFQTDLHLAPTLDMKKYRCHSTSFACLKESSWLRLLSPRRDELVLAAAFVVVFVVTARRGSERYEGKCHSMPTFACWKGRSYEKSCLKALEREGTKTAHDKKREDSPGKERRLIREIIPPRSVRCMSLPELYLRFNVFNGTRFEEHWSEDISSKWGYCVRRQGKLFEVGGKKEPLTDERISGQDWNTMRRQTRNKMFQKTMMYHTVIVFMAQSKKLCGCEAACGNVRRSTAAPQPFPASSLSFIFHAVDVVQLNRLQITATGAEALRNAALPRWQ
ncbi:hypothetical protein F2P81_005301 [Scophthalmus maximus]|uniref:Uncharacterized protein n=1 Tax=Scophthalmus maximus TaxID=52904 RepID=A0A6A4TA78_SCOMX|nr:hypothetical protein F2P81_005301 [Scophthalmus maximus]